MSTGRLEAFSDGVIAILITIMVLELRVPHSADWEALRPLLNVFLAYVLSFVMLGIYWNNHHHLLQIAEHVNGAVLWANLHLLFWLSLIPFVTGWMGENEFARVPTAVYGGVLFMAGLSYTILVKAIIAFHGADSKVALAIGKDAKGMLSLAGYAAAVPSALLHEGIALTIYVAVALMWLVPDRRIESVLSRAPEERE